MGEDGSVAPAAAGVAIGPPLAHPHPVALPGADDDEVLVGGPVGAASGVAPMGRWRPPRPPRGAGSAGLGARRRDGHHPCRHQEEGEAPSASRPANDD